MGRRTTLIGWACVAMAAAACGGPVTTEPPHRAAPSTSGPLPSPAKPARTIEPEQPDIGELWVRRQGDRIHVTGEPRPRPAGAGPAVGCTTVSGGLQLCNDPDEYAAVRWTATNGKTWMSSTLPVKGLLPWVVPSLRPRTLAVAAGGDGATLFPLERVVVSSDGGETWTTYEVPRVQGERRYTNGHVLLSGGRLLTIVDGWSDDRLEHPSDRHHGFFLSDKHDLGHLRPIEPTFSPRLNRRAGNRGCCSSLDASMHPDPVIWTTTWDHRVYASTDDGRSFREVPLH